MYKLTDLEVYNSATDHTNTDHFLFYAKFTPDLKQRIMEEFGLNDDTNLSSYFGMYNPAQIQLTEPDGYQKPDFSSYYKDIEKPKYSFIDSNGVLHLPGSMYHFTRYISPLQDSETFSDIENYPFRNYTGFIDNMKAQVDDAHLNGRVAECLVGHMYEDAWQIRGYEQFLEDMLLKPEWCEYILDRLTERNLQVVEAAARAGVDVLRTGDDVANQRTLMFSPDIWRRFIKSRWAKVYKAAKEINPKIKIWYHSDGNIEEIIPELIEIGVDILNPVQPECIDPMTVKRKYGSKLVLDGTIGTQTVMPFGTPEEVRNTVFKRVEELGHDGALILSPTHILEPEVPIDNINAFVYAMHEINNL